MTPEKERLFEKIWELLEKLPPDVRKEIIELMEEAADENRGNTPSEGK